MLFFCLYMIKCHFIHLVILIMVGLDNAGREIQRKTMYIEVTMYFYSFFMLKIPRTFQSTIKIIAKLSPEMETDFYSQALAMSCCFSKSATNFLVTGYCRRNQNITLVALFQHSLPVQRHNQDTLGSAISQGGDREISRIREPHPLHSLTRK